jgi:hypothetical protein
MVQGDDSNNKLYIILAGLVYVVVNHDTNVFSQQNQTISGIPEKPTEKYNEKKAEPKKPSKNPEKKSN